ncbi:MAG: hypothetical protein ABW321_03600 [Polyangiales bacterium]
MKDSRAPGQQAGMKRLLHDPTTPLQLCSDLRRARGVARCYVAPRKRLPLQAALPAYADDRGVAVMFTVPRRDDEARPVPSACSIDDSADRLR